MSLENIVCPNCKGIMKKSRIKVELETIAEDGTSGGKMEIPFTVCVTCHNMQLFPDVYQENISYKLFTE
jgi:hypothetical protein